MTQSNIIHMLLLFWNLFTHFLAALAAKFAILDDTQRWWSLGLGIFGGVMILLYDKFITYDFVQGQIHAGREQGGHGWIDSDPHAPWNFIAAVIVALVTFSLYVLLTH